MTHNPAVLQFMDSVVVVKSGEIVDQGSYSDLVARGGLAGLLAEGGQQEGVDGEEGEKKEVVKKEDGPLVETETDSARLTEDEEALTGKVSELLYRKDLKDLYFSAAGLVRWVQRPQQVILHRRFHLTALPTPAMLFVTQYIAANLQQNY